MRRSRGIFFPREGTRATSSTRFLLTFCPSIFAFLPQRTLLTFSLNSSLASAHPLGRELTAEEWESFQLRFGFVSEHGVQIPFPDASLYSPPEGKVSTLIALFEAGLCFPIMDFFNLSIREYGLSVMELTPITIYKIVGFELLCRALGHHQTVLMFKHFFNASNQSGTWNFSLRYPRTKVYVDRAPTLFGAEKELVGSLEKVSINGVDEIISLEKALQGLVDGDLECRDVDLVETLPPSVSSWGIEAIVGSESVIVTDEDPDL
ncbi:unnamed protein product [Lactuca saligna]|uniref:Transposase (putative) gypsy type domain-containing protein n=1 Tax=Lactuca saligna TaxID=75948 RepID=A0AA35URV1_LACSI|nr:unnamed protein product [Lactuca saligna]